MNIRREIWKYDDNRDIRTSIERTDVENVLNGDLNEFLKSYLLRD